MIFLKTDSKLSVVPSAGICVIVSGFQIYVKMNTGEDGITKSVVTLVGACLFLIGAFLVFPAFFGYRI